MGLTGSGRPEMFARAGARVWAGRSGARLGLLAWSSEVCAGGVGAGAVQLG